MIFESWDFFMANFKILTRVVTDSWFPAFAGMAGLIDVQPSYPRRRAFGDRYRDHVAADVV
ncbi:MAG: hypothetical protein CSA09_05240 [Candidatus Contendobacter odensis]|uniref:Uncharacterized protein n=1 Tax=Candidatus Contendibacter odensensis TaxID=1400860 RepID=A0A2G6PE50_9GAMM|nr:MAG: hypothetical protein CSA09_05240 [Candidatus Contendobacter odensis]